MVTGLPRSGLTVVSALIDYLPDSVCLNAPPWHLSRARYARAASELCQWLAGDFAVQRERLLAGKPVRDLRAKDGAPLLDHDDDVRRPPEKEARFFVRPRLSPDFTLAMKHHALYTALLPQLVSLKRFTCIAVIRHPLDVIASWQKRPRQGIVRGQYGVARNFWPELDRLAKAKLDPLDRMAQLYDAYIGRYHGLRRNIHILKYEDVTYDPLMVSELFGQQKLSGAARFIERRPRIFSTEFADAVRERFKRYGVFTKLYYPRL